MRNMVILLFISFMVSGCFRRSDPPMNMFPHTKMTADSMSILVPTSYSEIPWKTWGIHVSYDKLRLFRTIPNMLRETIRLTIRKLTKKQIEVFYSLLHKQTKKQFKKFWEEEPLSKREKRIHKEMGVSYYKRYIDFVDGLKCISSVRSQNILADGVGARNYWTKCVYYANDNSVKALSIDYRFYFTYNKTKFQNSTTPSLRLHKLKEIQNLFKKDVKEIFDSIKIHDMDRVKMKKEGLLYDRQYEIQEY